MFWKGRPVEKWHRPEAAGGMGRDGLLTKAHVGICKANGMHYIFTVVVVTWLYALLKNQNCTLKRVNFIVYELPLKLKKNEQQIKVIL